MTAALLVVLAALGGVAAASADLEVALQENEPAPSHRAGPQAPPVVHDRVAGGAHWRLETDKGPVHVWQPSGLDVKTAGTLIYVHGYYTNVDDAWEQHRLADQFRESRRNAVFIVPEAPAGVADRVRWSDPDALLATVRSQARIELPPGPVVAMGHSGAFRTLVTWLALPRLEQVILLDGLYNSEGDFAAWLRAESPSPAPHRMVIVGFETAERSQAFLASISDALVREGVPEIASRFKRREKQAKLLYVHSQYDHMGIVTEGRTIPVVLRLAPFPPL